MRALQTQMQNWRHESQAQVSNFMSAPVGESPVLLEQLTSVQTSQQETSAVRSSAAERALDLLSQASRPAQFALPSQSAIHTMQSALFWASCCMAAWLLRYVIVSSCLGIQSTRSLRHRTMMLLSNMPLTPIAMAMPDDSHSSVRWISLSRASLQAMVDSDRTQTQLERQVEAIVKTSGVLSESVSLTHQPHRCPVLRWQCKPPCNALLRPYSATLCSLTPQRRWNPTAPAPSSHS
eukprot:2699768-Amphidinium_carterae.1